MYFLIVLCSVKQSNIKPCVVFNGDALDSSEEPFWGFFNARWEIEIMLMMKRSLLAIYLIPGQGFIIEVTFEAEAVFILPHWICGLYSRHK